MKQTFVLLLLSRFSRVWLCATPQMAAHQAPLSLGFSRQEHWSGLPFPSSIHESEKWKWNRSVMSDSSRPHGLQPTRLLRPWDLPGKSTGVGCHCLSIVDIVSYPPLCVWYRTLTGFRTNYPQICPLGVLTILSWRNLRKTAEAGRSLTFSDSLSCETGHKTLVWEVPSLSPRWWDMEKHLCKQVLQSFHHFLTFRS